MTRLSSPRAERPRDPPLAERLRSDPFEDDRDVWGCGGVFGASSRLRADVPCPGVSGCLEVEARGWPTGDAARWLPARATSGSSSPSYMVEEDVGDITVGSVGLVAGELLGSLAALAIARGATRGGSPLGSQSSAAHTRLPTSISLSCQGQVGGVHSRRVNEPAVARTSQTVVQHP